MDHRSVVNRAVRAAIAGHGRARVTGPAGRASGAGDGTDSSATAQAPIVTDYPAGNPVTCDHAVFTSVRSPTGEGYRIIAASAGVAREERSEITQRSPSHGGLAGTGANAVGLLSYRLSSGRICVSLCRHAGTEHTARGGRRVHTHAVLLDDATLARFGHNEIRVVAAILRSADTPLVEARQSVPPIELNTPAVAHVPLQPTPNAAAGRIEHFMRCLLDDGRFILTGYTLGWGCLEAALDLVPRELRRERSLMAGLVFAPARDADVVLLDRIAPESMRSVRGRDIRCQPAGGSEMPHLPDAEPWLRTASQRLEQRRHQELARLVSRMGPAAGIDALNRVAKLLTDLDSIDTLDDARKVALGESYHDRHPSSDVERELVQRIRERTQPVTEGHTAPS